MCELCTHLAAKGSVWPPPPSFLGGRFVMRLGPIIILECTENASFIVSKTERSRLSGPVHIPPCAERAIAIRLRMMRDGPPMRTVLENSTPVTPTLGPNPSMHRPFPNGADHAIQAAPFTNAAGNRVWASTSPHGLGNGVLATSSTNGTGTGNLVSPSQNELDNGNLASTSPKGLDNENLASPSLNGLGDPILASPSQNGMGNRSRASPVLYGLGNASLASPFQSGIGNEGRASPVLHGLGNASLASPSQNGMGNGSRASLSPIVQDNPALAFRFPSAPRNGSLASPNGIGSGTRPRPPTMPQQSLIEESEVQPAPKVDDNQSSPAENRTLPKNGHPLPSMHVRRRRLPPAPMADDNQSSSAENRTLPNNGRPLPSTHVWRRSLLPAPIADDNQTSSAEKSILPNNGHPLPSKHAQAAQSSPSAKPRQQKLQRQYMYPEKFLVRNKAGQRLDSKIDAKKQQIERIKDMKLCNYYYLLGDRYCKGAARCNKDHSYEPTDNELEILKRVARMAPCERGVQCDNRSCIYGHHCNGGPEKCGKYGPNCSWKNCKFPESMHITDTTPCSDDNDCVKDQKKALASEE